jgi:hypothetical protein
VHNSLDPVSARKKESEGVVQKFTIPEALHPTLFGDAERHLSPDDSGGDSTLTPSRRLPISTCDFGGKSLLDALPSIAGTCAHPILTTAPLPEISGYHGPYLPRSTD